MGYFCPPGSGSCSRIRIWNHWPDCIRIRIWNTGYGTKTKS